jgi:hypothetical protein
LSISVSPSAEVPRDRSGPGAGGALLILAGLVACTLAVVGFCWALYSVMRIGTCASGGPYVSARPCPPGTGAKILLLVGSVFGGLLGLALYTAGWARAGRAVRSGVGLGTLLWSFTFLGAAAACGLAAFGPAAVDDGGGAKTAAITLFVVFIPMGVIPLIALLVLGRGRRPRATPAPAQAQRVEGIPGDLSPGATATAERPDPAAAPVNVIPLTPMPGAPTVADDPVDQLERLAQLRDRGAITAAEFERLKREILG